MAHRLIRLAGASALLTALIGLPAQAADQPAPVQAIWKTQQITFNFQSFSTYYSCRGLEDKLTRIMHALGAKAKVRVRSADCTDMVVRLPRVVMDVTAPIEATAEALAERDKDRSTRELAARVRGESAEQAAAEQEFAAHWKRISLSRGALGLEPGDCELIEELHRKVLPKLAVRVVNEDVRCAPSQMNLGQPRLEVEALVEAPKPDDPSPPR